MKENHSNTQEQNIEILRERRIFEQVPLYDFQFDFFENILKGSNFQVPNYQAS